MSVGRRESESRGRGKRKQRGRKTIRVKITPSWMSAGVERRDNLDSRGEYEQFV